MRMALHNIWARRKSSLKVLTSMMIMITILCIFVTYTIALEEKTEELVYSYRSGHYFATVTDAPIDKTTMDSIKSINNTNGVSSYGAYSPMYDIYGLDFEHQGEKLNCYHSDYRHGKIPSNASDMEIVFHRGKVAFVDSSADLFSTNDAFEAKYRWNNDNYLQSGNVDINSNGIIVSPEFLREYGLTDLIVGDTIIVKVPDNSVNSYQLTITGILNKHYFNLTGNVEMPQLIMSTGGEMYKNLTSSARMAYVTEVQVSDYMSARTVAKDLVAKAGVVDFETGSEYGLAMASTVTLVNMVLIGVMSTVGLGILIALLLNIMFSTQFMITKKANYYGMIRAYGATKSRVFWIMFFEIFILAIISTLLAYGLSYALAFLLKIGLSNMLGISIEFTPINFGLTFVAGIAFSIALLVIVTLINYATAIRSNVVHLLRRSIDS